MRSSVCVIFGFFRKMLKEKTGSYSLVLERPFSPFPIQQLLLMNDLDNLFNRGRVPFATWNNRVLASNLQSSAGSSGNSGFVMFSSKFLKPQGWNSLNGNGHVQPTVQRNTTAKPISQLVIVYIRVVQILIKLLFISAVHCQITEQIYVGSCIQTEDDVEALSNAATLSASVNMLSFMVAKEDVLESLQLIGITAILNFQTGTETQNWGINSNSINESCQKFDILMINYPIRDGDSFDLRKKLPFCVGLLLRLLKKNHLLKENQV
ncbi:putative protein-tyrosine phosphatase, phosphatase LSF1 [Rosa chinensis]|uniref:Uncharacterized protein n=1 Tax=Rosa chinensis TaxID=74649 RepID=A0A2P6S5I0_ROSCH|nr:putative protein-tyrosine phosphatase, phosphatase LSF1 [Rosa chinensis]